MVRRFLHPRTTVPLPAWKYKLFMVSSFLPSSSQKSQSFWVSWSFEKEHVCYSGNVMPDGCSTPKSFRIPCRKRAATLVEFRVQVLGLFCCELELTNWFSERWNPPIAWAFLLKYHKMKEIERNCLLGSCLVDFLLVDLFSFSSICLTKRPAVFQFWASFMWHAEHWSLPHQKITYETINLDLITPYTSLFLSRLENFKRETVDAHDPAPADIVNIPLPHSTCFRPVCNTPSPPWNVRWTRMILHAPKRALKRCHLTCIQNLPGATSPLKSHQQLPTKIGHLAFISLFPYTDYCVYSLHGKCMIRGYSWTCYFFP